MPKAAERYLKVEPWSVTERGFHKKRALTSESLFTLSNEYMGVRGYPDEGTAGSSMVGSYFNGVYSERSCLPSYSFKGMVERQTFLVNSVDWLHVRLSVGKETLDLAQSKVTSYQRRLDLRRGTLKRSFVWQLSDGRRLRLTFERLVSMVRPHIGAQRITFEPIDFSGTVRVRAGLDFSPIHYDEGRNLWRTLKSSSQGDLFAIMGEVEKTDHRVMSVGTLRSSTALKAKELQEEQFIGKSFSLQLKQGQETQLDRVVYNLADRSLDESTAQLYQRGLKAAQKELTVSYDELAAEQAAYWERVWEQQDIELEGDPENQQGIRFCIFHLQQAYHGVDPSLNVSAKGLSGEEYWGCTWWDTETYCLPYYLFSNPPAAKNLIQFRHQTLKGALQRAKELDCTGARYPMCTIDGPEICPVWQHGDLEIHVSAAVAYGIWHYAHITGDREFLHGNGLEMLVQISRYYASRGAWSPLTGEFGLYGVMGPDEFHMMVHNNAYTNVMAKAAMEWTLEVLDEVASSAPAKLASVKKKAQLKPEEPEQWREMAAKMRTNFDARTGLYEQHDGFYDLPHVDVQAIPASEFPIYRHWAYPRIFRYDMIKQPDALLLMFLLSERYTHKEKLANYEYYDARCAHESSLSPGIHSILANELGKYEQAYDYSLQSSRLDLDDYNRNTDLGVHTTSMAAAWMNFVYGFGGLRSDGELLSFRPHLPPAFHSLRFKLHVQHSLLEVHVVRESVSLRIVEGEPLKVKVFDREVSVTSEGVTQGLPKDQPPKKKERRS